MKLNAFLTAHNKTTSIFGADFAVVKASDREVILHKTVGQVKRNETPCVVRPSDALQMQHLLKNVVSLYNNIEKKKKEGDEENFRFNLNLTCILLLLHAER